MSMLSVPVVMSQRSSGIGSRPGTGTGTAGVEPDTTDGKAVAVDQFGADEARAGSMRKCFSPLQMSLQRPRAGLPSMNASTSACRRNPDLMIQSRRCSSS
jgi:hypothetical protein